MRILVTTTPVSTHFMPLVPLLWALRSAGHHLVVVGQPDVQQVVQAHGLSGVSIGAPFDVEAMLRDGLGPGQRPVQARPRLAGQPMAPYAKVWMDHARGMLADYLSFARGYRPDLIVSDHLEYTALLLAGVLRVPVVQHRWGVDPISTPARPVAEESLRDLCVASGLTGLPVPELLLDPCPPSLQVPDADPGTPIRCVPSNGGGGLPAWLRDERDGSPDRRVVVSLGVRTLVLNGISHMRQVLHAFDGLPDVTALATVGRGHRDEIGPVPHNVRMIDPMPLHLLFERCAAVIHHGGAGSAMTATAFGLPQVVLPQLADTFTTGDRLAAVGAGITVEDGARQDDPQVVAAAVAAVLAEPGYAKAAGELAAEMARMPSPARLAQDLERLVAERPASR